MSDTMPDTIKYTCERCGKSYLPFKGCICREVYEAKHGNDFIPITPYMSATTFKCPKCGVMGGWGTADYGRVLYGWSGTGLSPWATGTCHACAKFTWNRSDDAKYFVPQSERLTPPPKPVISEPRCRYASPVEIAGTRSEYDTRTDSERCVIATEFLPQIRRVVTRTQREWPTCPFGGRVDLDVKLLDGGQAVIGIYLCDRCSKVKA